MRLEEEGGHREQRGWIQGASRWDKNIEQVRKEVGGSREQVCGMGAESKGWECEKQGESKGQGVRK